MNEACYKKTESIINAADTFATVAGGTCFFMLFKILLPCAFQHSSLMEELFSFPSVNQVLVSALFYQMPGFRLVVSTSPYAVV
jgi:hypothetical protein